jgi:predicted metal-dependent phosphoesterase TrpH
VERLAVTDHDRLGLALRLAKQYPEQVIPGEEVRTAEGIDVIGLYLKEEIPRGTPAREVVKRVRDQGGIVYLPHPYAAGKGGGGRLAEELAPLVDVVEVFNARLHNPALNQAAEGLAERFRRLKGAGSDAHTPAEVGGAFVEVPHHPNEPAALLAALRSGRVHGRSASRAVHLASTWAKVRKKLPGSPGEAADGPRGGSLAERAGRT